MLNIVKCLPSTFNRPKYHRIRDYPSWGVHCTEAGKTVYGPASHGSCQFFIKRVNDVGIRYPESAAAFMLRTYATPVKAMMMAALHQHDGGYPEYWAQVQIHLKRQIEDIKDERKSRTSGAKRSDPNW